MSSLKLLLFNTIVATLLIRGYAATLLVQNFTYWTAFAVFSTQIIVWLVWSCVIYPKLFSPLRNLPQPSGSSFFMGQFWRLMKKGGMELQCSWVNEVPNDGVIMYPCFLNWQRILVVKPQALAEVMLSRAYDYVKPPHIKTGVGAIFGSGLVFIEGEYHKMQRKHLMPSFAFRRIKDLYPTFWGKSMELVDELKVYIGNENDTTKMSPVILVERWASRATLDIIGAAGLRQEFRAIQDPGNKLSKVYNKVCSPSKWALLAGMLGYSKPTRIIGSILVKFTDDFVAASHIVKGHCYSLIEAERRNISNHEKPHLDILSVALQSGSISDDELVNHLMTFLLAGHETVSAALSWVIYFLCRYPKVQARLRDELAVAIPLKVHDPCYIPTAAEIDGIAYLNAVCSEVLRLRPVVPQTFRQANVDTSIVGHYIPKGTIVLLCPWAVHRSKELWGEDAAEFRPDRWMAPGHANTGGAESATAFLTFLKGPRGCIGEAFARAELACLVAAWVSAFETEFADKDYVEEVAHGISSKPAKLEVRLKVIGA
ncbi:cytochrome P450 [Lepidopterella palustris CBS 459.81]|uniref:Cytochrome P450 n=1 Tax=Lepidopterella palustris CBS 459.81 TaxID=1314670 RepID=A0A8E2ECF6_9PEZI|nr:cytochrome P450 [Lepidopterella palustris CBS 459.81]